MGFLLFLVSVILSVILYPLAFLASIIKGFYKTSFKIGLDKLNQQFLDIATSIDANGNVVADDLFNFALIRKEGYQFGKRKETISSVLGKNQLSQTLTPIGWLLASLLDLIQKHHCFRSIDNQI